MKLIEQDVEVLTELNESKILKLIEEAGRTAYRSNARITPISATKFVKMIIRRGHLSVLEHFSITVKMVTTRAIANELVRHRIASYTQESTRYVNFVKKDNEEGIKFIMDSRLKKDAKSTSDADYRMIYNSYVENERVYNKLVDLGVKPEVARDVLPLGLATTIVTTMNLRSWLHFFELRTDKAAHQMMQELANLILNKFKAKLPVIFKDCCNDKL